MEKVKNSKRVEAGRQMVQISKAAKWQNETANWRWEKGQIL